MWVVSDVPGVPVAHALIMSMHARGRLHRMYTAGNLPRVGSFAGNAEDLLFNPPTPL